MTSQWFYRDNDVDGDDGGVDNDGSGGCGSSFSSFVLGSESWEISVMILC